MRFKMRAFSLISSSFFHTHNLKVSLPQNWLEGLFVSLCDLGEITFLVFEKLQRLRPRVSLQARIVGVAAPSERLAGPRVLAGTCTSL